MPLREGRRRRERWSRGRSSPRTIAGFRAVAGDGALRILVGLISGRPLVSGTVQVLIVVLAVEMLDLGGAGVGYLNTAFGVGAPAGAVGALLPLLVLALWQPLRRIEAVAEAPPPEEEGLLSRVPIVAPLPGTSLEHLAGRLIPLQVAPGTVIVRQGDSGDRFSIVVGGEVEVTADGESVAILGAGDSFGEIASIRDLPLTASVVAKTPVVLYALEREDFLAAVTGHPASHRAAEAVVSARLAGAAGARLPAA